MTCQDGSGKHFRINVRSVVMTDMNNIHYIYYYNWQVFMKKKVTTILISSLGLLKIGLQALRAQLHQFSPDAGAALQKLVKAEH